MYLLACRIDSLTERINTLEKRRYWKEDEHPRSGDGEFTSGGGAGKKSSDKDKPSGKKSSDKDKPSGKKSSDKDKPSGKKSSGSGKSPTKKKSTVPVFGAREQRHAEAQQDKLATAINANARSIPGSAPSDLERIEKSGLLTSVEVKTKLRSKSVRMSAGAIARKLARLEEHKTATGADAVLHTVAFDHREAYSGGNLEETQTFPCYYKRGGGSFALSAMEKVESAERLNELIHTADADLPEKARPTTKGFYGRVISAKPRERQKLLAGALQREATRAADRKGRK